MYKYGVLGERGLGVREDEYKNAAGFIHQIEDADAITKASEASVIRGWKKKNTFFVISFQM